LPWVPASNELPLLSQGGKPAWKMQGGKNNFARESAPKHDSEVKTEVNEVERRNAAEPIVF
jgi:hypothetical protein